MNKKAPEKREASGAEHVPDLIRDAPLREEERG